MGAGTLVGRADSSAEALGSTEVVDATIEGVVGVGVGIGLLGMRAGGGYLAKKRISRGGSDLASCMCWFDMATDMWIED